MRSKSGEQMTIVQTERGPGLNYAAMVVRAAIILGRPCRTVLSADCSPVANFPATHPDPPCLSGWVAFATARQKARASSGCRACSSKQFCRSLAARLSRLR